MSDNNGDAWNKWDADTELVSKSPEESRWEDGERPVTPVVDTVYEVKHLGQGDLLVTCPLCDNGAIVAGKEWLDGAGGEAIRSGRICTYCGEESLIQLPKWMPGMVVR